MPSVEFVNTYVLLFILSAVFSTTLVGVATPGASVSAYTDAATSPAVSALAVMFPTHAISVSRTNATAMSRARNLTLFDLYNPFLIVRNILPPEYLLCIYSTRFWLHVKYNI